MVSVDGKRRKIYISINCLVDSDVVRIWLAEEEIILVCPWVCYESNAWILGVLKLGVRNDRIND